MNEITYCVEVADMKAFQRHHRRVSPAIRRMRIFMYLFFIGLSLDSTLRHENGSLGFRIVYFLIMLGFLVGLGLVISLVTNWIVNYRAYSEGDRQGILGEHTVTLFPDLLQERTVVNDTKAAWRGIHRIDSTTDHIFIFTQPNAAHSIPRRAFATHADAEQFLSVARAYHEAAQKSA